MPTVQLTDEQQAVLARNLATDKRVINAQRRDAKRKRDEARQRARAQKALEIVAAMAAPQPDLTLAIAAAVIDRFPVKIGKVWVR